ncbi:metallophosphoesterase [Pendulispora rubella]|uniref:Metallophosphoesterase n=1 Tax=Pendulispora rubella TaxID=2741070 RepID=A0ABZ2LG83_9BACT
MNRSSFVLAHVSDLHVSTFGDTFHDRARIVKRSVHLADADSSRYEEKWSEAGWRVLHQKGARPARLALIDPEGYAHAVPSTRESGGIIDPVERAAAKACRLEARRANTLAQAVPSDGALRTLQQATPKNSNVRLLRAVRYVEESDADAVIVTGDITDDGDGYELVEAAFQRWKDKGRLFAIPGNHDLYLFPLAGSGRPRPSSESKRAAWKAFAARIGLDIEPCGAWFNVIADGEVAFIGLDSCARPQRRFFRHNGGIGPEQIEYMRAVAETPEWKGARHRLVALHHHVVPLPHGVGRRAPSEIGMRLDDARTVAEVFNEIGATLVMHGHRHISEERQPAGCNFRLLASPSLTLGCRSGDAPSFWRVELGKNVHAERVRLPIEAVEQENDPGTEDMPGGPADE